MTTDNLTALERKLSQKRQKLKQLFEKYTSEIENLEKQILPVCPHKDTESYTWHHGYGQYVTGEICKFCRSRRSFKGMGAWQTEEQYYKNLKDNDD